MSEKASHWIVIAALVSLLISEAWQARRMESLLRLNVSNQLDQRDNLDEQAVLNDQLTGVIGQNLRFQTFLERTYGRPQR